MRTTIATHWIGAAANLITGSDLTAVDASGKKLLTNSDAVAVAQYAAKYHMQPRNPGTGQNSSRQLQAWIAGPDASRNAVVILAHQGPDGGQGGFGTNLQGGQLVKATWADLRLDGRFNVLLLPCYNLLRIHVPAPQKSRPPRTMCGAVALPCLAKFERCSGHVVRVPACVFSLHRILSFHLMM